MVEMLNIAEVLCAQAQTHPDKPALLETRAGRPRSLTFAQLERDSARTSTRLKQLGLQRGDAAL
ncbi:MAG TPA: AMP-binding protein, partial [Candidatus Bipolaricaulota bacterium]